MTDAQTGTAPSTSQSVGVCECGHKGPLGVSDWLELGEWALVAAFLWAITRRIF